MCDSVDYPTKRDLCGVFFRVERQGKWCNICYSDMTREERGKVRESIANRLSLEEQVGWWSSLADIIADALHEVGDEFDIVCSS